MMSLDLLENEFKLLGNAAGKRFPNIKEAVDKALKAIETSKGQQPYKLAENEDIIVQPFVLVFQNKVIKLYVPSLNCLQKMATSNIISDEGTLMILSLMKEACHESIDEMTQIKILQILLIFLNPNAQKLSKNFVDLVLQCCFQMFYSKSNSVKSTIQATLRQLFTIVFDSFVHSCKLAVQNEDFFDSRKRNSMKPEELQLCLNQLKAVEKESIFTIINDLIQNISKALSLQEQNDKKAIAQQQVWNLSPSIHSKCIVMDIICLILHQTQDYLHFFSQTLKVFDNEMVPVLEQMFKNKQNDYITGMRLMKCSIMVMNNLGVGVNLVGHILSEADSLLAKQRDGSFNQTLSWKSLIGFECLAIALNNSNLVKMFSQSALQVGKPILVQIFETLIQATEHLDLTSDFSQKHLHNPAYLHQKTPKFIEAQILESEMPPPQPLQIHKLIIESMCSFVDNLIIIFDQQGLRIGSCSQSRMSYSDLNKKQSNKKGQIDCKELLVLSWKPLLTVLQNLLKVTQEESHIQMLLKCYQNFIGVCGSVQCYEARDGFLESLCGFCLTVVYPKTAHEHHQMYHSQGSQQLKQQELTLTEKNIHICKTLLNIAHCLGYILDVKSWYIILETMQKIESVISLKLKTKGKQGMSASQPGINQSGNQTLVDFQQIKVKVLEKMKEYSIVERSHLEVRKEEVVEEEKKSNQPLPSKMSQSSSEQSSSKVLSTAQSQQDSASKGKPSRPTSVNKKDSSLSNSSILASAAKEPKLSQSLYESNNSMQTAAATMPYDPLVTDLQILQDSFDSLFTSSLLFDQQSLAELITSLGQLTVGVLENIGNKKSQDKAVKGATSKNQPNETEVLANISTFAITRLVETALVNISRIELIWKILIAHFDILSNCKVQTLRQLSIEALLCIILDVFAYNKVKGSMKPQRMSSITTPTSENRPSLKVRTSKTSSAFDDEDDFDIDVDENWSGTIWQYTTLTPFTDQLKSPHPSNKLQTLKGIEKIIQTCGQQLKNDGWRIIIITISKTPEIDNDQVIGTGFRCLKLIVSNYIEKLSQENFITILHAINKYATSDCDNINNNLTAIGMLMNIADYTAKQMQKEQQNENITTVSIVEEFQINTERIWTILFEKIQELGVDKRVEIRRANIHTLENIIMTHGSSFPTSVWNAILTNVLLDLCKNSVDMYTQSKGVPVQKRMPAIDAPTPTFAVGGLEARKKGQSKNKMNFDPDTVLKALQKNNDEQWEETCLLLVQTLIRSIKKYNQLQTKSTDKVKSVWSDAIEVIIDLIKYGTQDICTTIYKSIEDLLSHPPGVELFMNNINQSFLVFEGTAEWLGQEKQDNGGIARKPTNLKLCPIIIDTLKKVYSDQHILENSENNQDRIIAPNMVSTVFNLLYKMMKYSKSGGEGFQGMGIPAKLLTEEKLTFDFIQSLNDIVSHNTKSQLLYLQFLLKFTHYELTEPHSEAFIRRTFSIINTLILQGKLSTDILKEILPPLYDRIQNLINLRYSNEACMGLVFPAKGSQTIFYTVGLYAMYISSFLINPEQFKTRMTAHFEQTQEKQRKPMIGLGSPIQVGISTIGVYSGGLKSKTQLTSSADDFITSNDIMFAEQLEFSIIDPAEIKEAPTNDSALKQIVWERVIPLARDYLLFKPEQVTSHNKAVVEDVVKSSQDLDMQVMNFITNSLLPNIGDINDKDFQQSLVAIIDNGCNSVYSSQRLTQGISSTTSGHFGNTLSKYCLNNLFELCRYQPLQLKEQDLDLNEQKLHEIRRKIATITTPMLINRCRDTLKKFAYDELKSGSMSLPRQKINEAVFILEKLRMLDCYPEVSPQQYKTKKSHLVQLMPIFADLVLSNENDLKEHLRLIFIDISASFAETALTSGSQSTRSDN